MKTYTINNAGTLCRDLGTMLSDDIAYLINTPRFGWGNFSENLRDKFNQSEDICSLPIFSNLIGNGAYVATAFIDYVKPKYSRVFYNVSGVTQEINEVSIIIPLYVPKEGNCSYLFLDNTPLKMYTGLEDIPLVREIFNAVGPNLIESKIDINQDTPLLIGNPRMWVSLSNLNSEESLVYLRMTLVDNPTFDCVVSYFN